MILNRKIQVILCAVLLLFFLDILLGSVYIPPVSIIKVLFGQEPSDTVWHHIVMTFRLPKALTALLVGAALAVSGLQMQTLFRNPLAGPFVLGVSSGASLGVALTLMASGVLGQTILATFISGSYGIILAASVGAVAVLLLVVLISQKIPDNTTLLIIGLMIGHVTSAAVGILQYFADAESLQGFVLWSLGSFNNVVWNEMKVLMPVILVGLMIAFAFSKTLNALLLGEHYAKSLGIHISSSRLMIILSTGLLAGGATAFCGPIAFLGLAIPHLARPLFNSSDHKVLVPACVLIGGGMALVCDIIAQFPGSGKTLPLNAVTSLIGAPVVIWVIVKQRKY
jgi:iron complex transport system permease protein